MKIVVALFLLAYCQSVLSVDVKGKEQGKTEKRALREGNAFEKREPLLSTVSPSPIPAIPGVIYADSKPIESDKSPAQQIYSTPVPPVAKISDVLTGQGPSFPTAIESHLYSPVQVYQPRLGSPTTYEVSAPIPSQLAYIEHKTYQQPQQNSIQYYEQQRPQQQKLARVTVNFGPHNPQQYVQQPLLYPQQNQIIQSPQFLHFRHIEQPVAYQQPINYNQVPLNYNEQSINYDQQPINYNQQPNNYNPQPVNYNQQPANYNQQPVNYNQQPVNYNQQPVNYIQQPVVYRQNQLQQPLVLNNAQPGITYADQGQFVFQTKTPANFVPQQLQRDVKTSQPITLKVLEKPTLPKQAAVNIATEKNNGAVSYASFSQSQPSQNFNFNNQIQSQVSYSPTNNKLESSTSEPQNAPSPHLNRLQIVPYFRPQTIQQVPQFYTPQPQVYAQSQDALVQNRGYIQQAIAVAPTFPPVQYFGKYASAIFGKYQQT